MDRHRCKVCFRNFTNGSALGGHMRSHMKNFYVSEQEKEHNPEKIDDLQSLESYSSISSQYLSSQKDDGIDDEKQLQVDPEFSSVLVQDRESDTDSSKDHSICRRSKRVRDSIRTSEFASFRARSLSGFKKSKFGDHEAKTKCAAITPVEDVAYCLMMLSRDRWEKDENKINLRGERYRFGDDFCGDSDASKVGKNKVRGKYRCETCNKLFRSYQALGGHMASHKKMTSSPSNHESSSEMADSGGGSAAGVEEEKVHECPFCERVFSSGQALGGHKRSHFVRGGGISRTNMVRPVVSTPDESISRNGKHLKLDLNLPAPVQGDEDEMSQIAVSSVFDP
ncbi:hypothetical protein F511_18742 [Dorcoceras hygrometricum]|uniref:C2H2-type domain-containing protein n=1 Tax=Dorcoceras hygrometricum TaxID=472368 RepID=A0A2Z7BEF0_9LAMI|nr:hypothetical protein F511_18742 [Dorcoceras hygrometricum]